MNKHTPGPWSVNGWTLRDPDITIGSIGTPWVAKIPLRDVSINEQRANAHLVAAAPDLLQALKMALHYMPPSACDTFGIIHRALDKAEGKS